ncbi:MAG: F0F1 ATP synthase subunit A, partial [Candidatus Dependentiae bacterium]|nr:F0F1 ATP synthase subunit A [Candidatus Dependentiae bacterium]
FFDLNRETIINTWGALGVIIIFSLVGRWAVRRPEQVVGHLFLTVIRSFADMISQSLGRFSTRYFFFIASLFLYLIICNALVIIPGFEEPTSNVNTTFALAIIAFAYVQREAIGAHGLLRYIQEYLKMPFSIQPSHWSLGSILLMVCKLLANIAMAIFSLPMEILSKSATIISLSLRLFGNIFGGSVITKMVRWVASGSWLKQSIALLTGLNIVVALFFGLFEAFIQALVFSILTLTYISIAVQSEEESEERGQADGHVHTTPI